MLNEDKTTILIVDDREMNIYALEQILSTPGRNFLSASNGQEALKIVLQSEVDLIILDVQMPDMDGFEVAQILKSHKRTKDIPILFASAEQKQQKLVPEGVEEGIIDYLYKPLDPEITEAKVSLLLMLQIQKKELAWKNTELEKYALLINNSEELICVINADTLKFEEVNETVTKVLGYSMEEIKGTSILTYISEEDRAHVKELSKENNEELSFETLAFGKGKITRRLHWKIINKNGFWFANATDITPREETSAQTITAVTEGNH